MQPSLVTTADPRVVVAITTITGTTHTLVTEDAEKYLRFTSNSAKTLVIPAAGDDFVIPANTLFTIRNAGSLDLTIMATAPEVLLKKRDGADVLVPFTTAQILYIGANEWDIL